MPTVKVPNVGLVAFPEGMTPEQMHAEIIKAFPDQLGISQTAGAPLPEQGPALEDLRGNQSAVNRLSMTHGAAPQPRKGIEQAKPIDAISGAQRPPEPPAFRPGKIGEAIVAGATSLPGFAKQMAGGMLQSGIEQAQRRAAELPESYRAMEYAIEAPTPEVARGQLERGRALYEAGAAEIEAKLPKDMRGPEQFAYDLSAMLAQMLPVLGVGMTGAGGMAAVTPMAYQVYGQRYGALRKQGVDPDLAHQSAMFSTASETLTEAIPIALLFRAGTPALRRVLEMTVGEGLQESASSLLESAWAAGKLGEDMTLGQALRAAGYEGVIGAAGGAIMGGAVAGAQAGIERATRPSLGEAQFPDARRRAIEALEPDPGRTWPRLAMKAEQAGAFAPQQEGKPYAEEVRSDQRQVPSEGRQQEAVSGESSPDLQQPAQPEPEASGTQARAQAVAPETPDDWKAGRLEQSGPKSAPTLRRLYRHPTSDYGVIWYSNQNAELVTKHKDDWSAPNSGQFNGSFNEVVAEANRRADYWTKKEPRQPEPEAGRSQAKQEPKQEGAQIDSVIPRKLYRGYGRADQGERYSSGVNAEFPVIGSKGKYFSFDEETAKQFGPNIERADLKLQNPLVIRSDDQWAELTGALGWRYVNPSRFPRDKAEADQARIERKRETEALDKYLSDNGHDGVIVYWDDTAAADQDKYGNWIKNLRRVFGEPQVYVLDRPTQQPKPTRSAETPKPAAADEGSFDQDVDLTKPKRKGPSRDVDPTKDDILRAVAKLGGLSREHAQAQGIDPAEFGRRGFGVFRVFTNGGRSFDAMAETLSQMGYMPERYTANELLDKIDAALRGETVLSNKASAETIDALVGTEEDRYGPQAAELDATPAERETAIAYAEALDVLTPEELEEITERVALQNEGLTDDAFDAKLQDEIANAASAKRRGAQEVNAQAPAIAPGQDLAGEVNETAQAIHNRREEMRRREREAPPMEQGPGLLFSDAGQQIDLTDVAKAKQPAVEPLERTPEQAALIKKYGLPDDTVFEAGHRAMTAGKFRALEGNWSDSLEAAAKNAAEWIAHREEGEALKAKRENAEANIAAKLRRGEKPSFAEWQALFPHLKDGYTYVRQPDISPFLVEYFGFSRNRIRSGLGKAAGTLRSDTGATYPIVYLDRLAEVLSTTKPKKKRTVKRGGGGSVASRAPASAEAMTSGANYVGAVTTPYVPSDVSPQVSKDIKRREDILKPFLKALGVPIYYGTIKRGAGVLGLYLPTSEAVRIKRANDIETVAHEIAHLLDDRIFNGFGKRRGEKDTRPWLHGPRHRIYAKELKGVSYDEKKVYEGFAEFVRLWMTQPDAALAAAPEFYEFWEDLVSRHEYGPALKKAKSAMLEWFAQSEIDKMASKQGGDPAESVNKVVDSLAARVREAVFDDLHGLLLGETSITGDRVGAPGGIYETARQMRAAYSVVDGALRFGPPRRDSAGNWVFTDRQGNPSHVIRDGHAIGHPNYTPWGLVDILGKVGGKLDLWTHYAVARSAAELKEQGRERLFTSSEIRAGLDLARHHPEFVAVFDEWLEWNQAILDFAQQMGLINDQQRASWRRSQYLPFYRVGQRRGVKRAKGIEGAVSVTKMLTGGTENLRPILSNMIENTSRLIVEAIKNDARTQAVDFFLSNRGGGRFLIKMPKDIARVEIDKEQVFNEFLRTLGLDPKVYAPKGGPQMSTGNETIDKVISVLDENMAQWVRFMQFGQAPRGDQIIAIRRNGKLEYYKVADPLVYDSFASFNRQHLRNPVMDFFMWARRMKQATITLTATFMGRNFWRDTIHGWVFSNSGFRPFIDSFKGIAHRLENDAAYRAYIANGGGLASYLVDEDAMRSHISHLYSSKRGIDPRWVLWGPKKAYTGLMMLADAVEMGSRIGEFERGLLAGSTPRHAAYSGREVSVDFSMRGSSKALNVLYDTVIFLKAGMNGLDRAYRGLTKDVNRGAIAAKTASLAAASAAYYLLFLRDNPCYEALPDWDKDVNLHVFIPKRTPTGECGDDYLHLRFPKPFEVGAIMSSSERTAGAMVDQYTKGLSAEDAWKYGKRLANIFADLFRLEYVPAAVEPLYETYILNRSRFRDQDIETKYDESLLPYARYGPYTSRSLVELAELTRDMPPALQLSPKRMEALVYGYLTTYGTFGLMMLDEARFGDKLPEWRTDQMPVIRAFTRQHPLYQTKYENEFWDLARTVGQFAGTFDAMIDRNRPELAKHAAMQPDAAFEQTIQGVKQQVSAINDAMITVRRSDMTPREKRLELDALQKKKNVLFEKFMQRLHEER